MIDASVARRYARALIAAAAQEDHHEKVGDELEAIAAALATPKAHDVLVNPTFNDKQRRALVMALAASATSPVPVATSSTRCPGRSRAARSNGGMNSRETCPK